MRLLRNAPIKRKLMLVIMLTSGISMLLVCTAVTIYESILFRKDATDQLTTMAEMIGNNSKAPLIFQDAKSATETLDALRADSRIVAASVASCLVFLIIASRTAGTAAVICSVTAVTTAIGIVVDGGFCFHVCTERPQRIKDEHCL